MTADGTMLIYSVPFPAWPHESRILVELTGQLGFESVAITAGLVLAPWNPLLSPVGGSVEDNEPVYIPAAQWGTVVHTACYAVAGGYAVYGAGVILRVGGGMSAYTKVSRKITRIPQSMYYNES